MQSEKNKFQFSSELPKRLANGGEKKVFPPPGFGVNRARRVQETPEKDSHSGRWTKCVWALCWCISIEASALQLSWLNLWWFAVERSLCCLRQKVELERFDRKVLIEWLNLLHSSSAPFSLQRASPSCLSRKSHDVCIYLHSASQQKKLWFNFAENVFSLHRVCSWLCNFRKSFSLCMRKSRCRLERVETFIDNNKIDCKAWGATESGTVDDVIDESVRGSLDVNGLEARRVSR